HNEMMPIKTFGKNIVISNQNLRNVILQKQIGNLKIPCVIQHIQVFGNGFAGKVFSGETNHAIKNGKRITQGTISFLGNYVKRVVFGINVFCLCNFSKMFFYIANANSSKIENL